MKVCSRCGMEKPISDFYHRKQKGRDYIVARCKICCSLKTEDQKERDRQHSRKQSEKLRELYGTLPSVHHSMKDRCNNPRAKDYKNYGAKGVLVCKEWQNVHDFCKWALANGYKKKLTIDRIDSDGNYEPSNCRFVTMKENIRNKKGLKLNMMIAGAIRVLHENGYKQADIAGLFNIDARQVHKVIKNKTWR